MLATLLAFTLASALDAQTQPSFGERIEVKLVEVDVVVTDQDGNRVHGLTAADFQIFEGRHQQPITNFTSYGAPEPQPAESIAGPPLPEPPRQRQSILVVVDALPKMGRVRETAFAQLDSLISEIMRGGDRASVIFWNAGYGRPEPVVDSARDPEAVRTALRQLGQTSTAKPFSIQEDSESSNAFIDRGAVAAAESGQGSAINAQAEKEATERIAQGMTLMAFRRKTAALRLLVTSLGASPGKKTVVYVSNGLLIPGQASERLSALTMAGDLAKAANAAGVTCYAVFPAMPVPPPAPGMHWPDPRPPETLEELNQSLEALTLITKPTGGLLDYGLQSVQTLGRKVAEDVTSYYSLAYRARSDGSDRERRISVKTTNPRYGVRTRTSFVEKSNETIARDTLMARLFADTGDGDISFEVQAGEPRRSGRDQWLLPLVIRIPAGELQFVPEGGERVARIAILIVAANGLTEVTPVKEDDLRVVESKHLTAGYVKYSVEILRNARGSKLSIGVFDRGSNQVGVRTIDNRNAIPQGAH